MFPSTYFYAHVGISHKKNSKCKCQDEHKFLKMCIKDGYNSLSDKKTCA